MKKILAILLAAGAYSGALAQSSTTERAKDIIYGEPTPGKTTKSKDIKTGEDRDIFGRRTTSYPSSREGRIDRVNREYDEKIQSIRNNRRLSSSEKEKMIRVLNEERAREIRAINGNYKQYDGRQKDKKFKHHKHKNKYKDHPGKHKGWSKGKGHGKKRD